MAYTSVSLFVIERNQDRTPSRAGNWKQELMQIPHRNVVYWLGPLGLLSLLSIRTQDHQPRDGTMDNGLGPPHQSLSDKMILGEAEGAPARVFQYP